MKYTNYNYVFFLPFAALLIFIIVSEIYRGIYRSLYNVDGSRRIKGQVISDNKDDEWVAPEASSEIKLEFTNSNSKSKKSSSTKSSSSKVSTSTKKSSSGSTTKKVVSPKKEEVSVEKDAPAEEDVREEIHTPGVKLVATKTSPLSSAPDPQRK